jgi:diphosphomevalonate decarboxylase
MTHTHSATAQAHPNIAFIKYWGNRDERLRLPANGSISMNLDGLYTRTTVSFQPSLALDELVINGHEMTGPGLKRVSAILDEVRAAAGLKGQAEVTSDNNFPSGAGIASSAAAFAALALAATKAAGLDWDEAQISRLARHGSGSACRSVPAGFVEWEPGTGDDDSVACFDCRARTLGAGRLCMALVSSGHKSVGSTEGHALASTSPLQGARVADAPTPAGDLPPRHRGARFRRAGRDHRAGFEPDARGDDDLEPGLVLLAGLPRLTVMHAVREWRAGGLPVAYTIDAGPNVHVICPQDHMPLKVAAMLTGAARRGRCAHGPGGWTCKAGVSYAGSFPPLKRDIIMTILRFLDKKRGKGFSHADVCAFRSGIWWNGFRSRVRTFYRCPPVQDPGG